MLKFKDTISLNPALIYATALPLTATSSSISAQYTELMEVPIGLSRRTIANFSDKRTSSTDPSDGTNFDPADYQFFDRWKIDDGWVIGTEGEKRLWLPEDMRKRVRQVEDGLFVHGELDLEKCNGASKGHRGFIIT